MKTDYLELLENSHHQINELLHSDEPITRIEYLSEYIFNFFAFDDDNTPNILGSKCLEVCTAINNQKISEYLDDKDNVSWFILIINTHFLKNKICFDGTNTSWLFKTEPLILKSTGIFINDEQVTTLKFTKNQWIKFINAMNGFIKRESLPYKRYT
jgi:hypothetical protein